MIEIIIAIACLISIWYCWKSLIACATADLSKAAFNELYKIAVNIVIIIYLYVQNRIETNTMHNLL